MSFRIGFLFAFISLLTACGKKTESISIDGRWQVLSSTENGKQTLNTGQMLLLEFSDNQYRTSDSAMNAGAWSTFDKLSRSGNKLTLFSANTKDEYDIASLSQNAMKLTAKGVVTELQRTGTSPSGSGNPQSPTTGGGGPSFPPSFPGNEPNGNAISGYWVAYEGEQAYQSEAVFTVQFNANFTATVSSAEASFPSGNYHYDYMMDVSALLQFNNPGQTYQFSILSQSESEIRLRQNSGQYFVMVKIQ